MESKINKQIHDKIFGFIEHLFCVQLFIILVYCADFDVFIYRISIAAMRHHTQRSSLHSLYLFRDAKFSIFMAGQAKRSKEYFSEKKEYLSSFRKYPLTSKQNWNSVYVFSTETLHEQFKLALQGDSN